MKNYPVFIFCTVGLAALHWLVVNLPSNKSVHQVSGEHTPFRSSNDYDGKSYSTQIGEPINDFSSQKTGQLNINQRLIAIIKNTNIEKRNSELIKALDHVNNDNIRSAITLIESTIPRNQENFEVYITLLRLWADFDGAAATDYTFTSLEGNLRLDAGVAAVRSWASNDLYAASNYIAELPDTYGKDYVVYDFVFPFVDKNPQDAMSWVYRLPDSIRGTAALHAMNYWLIQDSEAATTWVTQSNEVRAENESIREVALYWVRQDLEKASLFVSQLKEDHEKAVAMESIVDWLATERPVEVANWLNHFEESQSMDRTFSEFAKRISQVDLESAMSWAAAISDEEFRMATVSEIDRRVNISSEEAEKRHDNRNQLR